MRERLTQKVVCRVSRHTTLVERGLARAGDSAYADCILGADLAKRAEAGVRLDSTSIGKRSGWVGAGLEGLMVEAKSLVWEESGRGRHPHATRWLAVSVGRDRRGDGRESEVRMGLTAGRGPGV